LGQINTIIKQRGIILKIILFLAGMLLLSSMTHAEVAFRKGNTLYVVTDVQRGTYTSVTSGVDDFKSDNVIAFRKGNTLYAVTDFKLGNYTSITSGVDSFSVSGSTIAFKKGSTLYVVTDVQRGDYTSVTSDVDDYK
jgi:hypothetical protein